jgi:predicted DNA-binding ribbon-helix-helix protein
MSVDYGGGERAMCEVYVKADPMTYESRSRSIRMHGVVTTIRLENLFWSILADMAAEQGTTTNSLIAQLHDEVLALRGEVPNFASFLRVTCLRFRQIAATQPGVADAAPGTVAPVVSIARSRGDGPVRPVARAAR